MKIKSPEFQALQKYWYNKLKQKGFNDIENVHTDTLKTYSLSQSDNKERFKYLRSRQIYTQRFYELCNQLRYDPKYLEATKRYPKRRKIWDLYCAGDYPHIIGQKVKMSTTAIRYIIGKYIPMVIESNSAKYDDESDSD
jgi:hypothetical protein